MSDAMQIAQRILEREGDGNAADFVTLGDIKSLAAAYLALTQRRLWLWKNCDHFLAFPSLFPTMPDCDDPATLGEPSAWAVLRSSRPDKRDTDAAEIARAEEGIRRGWRK